MKKINGSPRAQAFTLIEMLVVIAIIALLAAIVVPSVGSSIRSGKQVKSMAQLRQLGLGLLQVAYEDERFPLGYNQLTGETWDTLLRERMGIDESILHAPLDRVKRNVGSQEVRSNPRKWRSYSMVRNEVAGKVLGIAGRVWSSSIERPSTKLFLVEDPSNTLLIVERFDPSNIVFNLSGAVLDSPNNQNAGLPFTIKGRFVYGFCDGSSRVLAPKDTIGTGTMDRPLGMWSYALND